MKIYWTLASVPELGGLDRSARGKVWRRAYWKAWRHWQVWAALLLVMLLGNAASGYGIWGTMLGVGVGAFVFVQVAINQGRPYMREIARESEG